MSLLLASFRDNFVWSLGLFSLLFVIFAIVFAEGHFGHLIGGVLRVLFSLFFSPFVFLRKAVASVSAYDRDTELQMRKSNQYMMTKLALAISVVGILSSIGMIAAGGLVTWKTWTPSKEAADEAKEYGTRVEEQRTRVNEAPERWKESQQERLNEMEETYTRLKEQAGFHWKAAAMSALMTIIVTAGYLWFFGLLVEGSELAIRVADDLRRLRENSDHAKSSPAVGAPISPRLSVREPDVISAVQPPPATT